MCVHGFVCVCVYVFIQEHGFTPLMAAAANGHCEVVLYLLEHHIPVDATDKVRYSR